jgi:hypothetical protein
MIKLINQLTHDQIHRIIVVKLHECKSSALAAEFVEDSFGVNNTTMTSEIIANIFVANVLP